MPHSQTRKVTLSLPNELIAYADSRAAAEGTTRSSLIGGLLEDLRRHEHDKLAREGYRFYASDSEEFASASAGAVAEALGDDSPSW